MHFPLNRLLTSILTICVLSLFFAEGFSGLSGFIFQREGQCAGDCNYDQELAKQVFDHLSANRPLLISSDEDKLYDYQAKKSCSAMALDFAARYLSECSEELPAESMIKVIATFKPYYRLSTATFNSRQAAFNTITVDPERGRDDPEFIKHLKMQALANYHGLLLNPATRTIELKEVKEDAKSFNKIIGQLADGVYVLRALKPDESRKMEKYGHTMVFIRRRELSLFYDNRDGVVSIFRAPENYVRSKLIKWKIPECRFYKALPGPEGTYNLSTESTL